LRDSTRLVIAVLGAVCVLAVVAAGTGAFRSGGSAASPGDATWMIDGLELVAVVVFAFALPVVLYVLGGAMNAAGASQRKHRPWWVPVLVGLVLSVLAAVTIEELRRNERRDRPEAVAGQQARPPGERARDGRGGSQLDWWLIGLGVVVGLAGAWTALRVAGRGVGDEQSGDSEQLGVVADAAGESLDAVLAEPDNRRAVIMAYQRMEGALGREGFPRAAWETPFEYLDRVFAQLGAPKPVATTLTELYELAKFGDRPVGGEMRDAAISALIELREQLHAET
jgi:hypothetical protein